MMFDAAKRLRSAPAKAWALAILAFLVALAVRFATDHLLPVGFPYLTFFPAVILTTFFCGLLPGAACAIAGGLAAWYWFIPPSGAFAFNASVLIALAFYAFVVVVDILLIQVMHRAVEGLEAERVVNQGLLRQGQIHLEEQRMRERQQRVLQRELSHRMKNTLAMVQAVVSQSLRNATDPKEAAAMASARIQALARAQDALTATDWQASDVATIVETSLAPHRDGTDRFVLAGPPVELEARHALGLALAIHELATNATKHGSLANDTGIVRVSWSVQPEDRFLFQWREEGGPAVQAPVRRGFGSRLTERIIPAYFDGQAAMDFAPSGLIYSLGGSLRADVQPA